MRSFPEGQSFIISGPSAEEVYEKALEIAAGRAGNREKVFAGVHPDVVTVRPGEGKAKNGISVDQVRAVVADALILPNEGEGKVYIFAEAQLMNTEAQNAALKLLEEPPEAVTLILCCRTSAVFLQTVRSRCVEISLHGAGSAGDEAAAAFAAGYLKAVSSGRELELVKFCEGNTKLSIKELKDCCLAVKEALARLLPSAQGKEAEMRLETILRVDSLMDRCLEYLSVNVSVKQILGLLETEDYY